MAEKRFLAEREHVLEEEYFWRKEQELLARLRDEGRLRRQRRALGERLGVDDERFLTAVLDAGFTADTMDLLHLVPLVEVAWADGVVSSSERERILALATGRGVEPGSSACQQLTAWLDTCPEQQVFDVAFEAIRVILAHEDPAQQAADARTLVDCCTRVATATGEILGLRRISRAERDCLQRIAHGLTDTELRVVDARLARDHGAGSAER